jgi:hypothetical protein
MPASTMNGNAGTTAGLPQPQTTIEPPGGPFIRHSQPGRRPMYQLSSQTYGNTITQPLVAAPGYFRGFRMKFTGSGGTGSGAVASADAPYNCISLVTLKDAFGTPLIVAPGYEALYLIPKFGGQFGTQETRDPSNLPSWRQMDLAGNYQFSTVLPFEFSKAYGVISGANASLLPTLILNTAPQTALYQTVPTGGTPVLNIVNDSDFYWLPEGVSVMPPGLGTTCQWVYQQCTPTIGSGSTTTVQLPRLGGYLNVLILELRDANGQRVDAWPSRLRLYVDGVPLIDSDMDAIFDDMAIQFQGTSRPTGVIAISRRTSLSQEDMALFDTGETYLSTNPGTLLEVQGAPWGTVANPPITMSCIIGQVVPSGTLVQGLPEL